MNGTGKFQKDSDSRTASLVCRILRLPLGPPASSIFDFSIFDSVSGSEQLMYVRVCMYSIYAQYSMYCVQCIHIHTYGYNLEAPMYVCESC